MRRLWVPGGRRFMTTMSPSNLLATLARREAELYVEAGTLKYRGPKRPPDDPIRPAIRAHRGELVRMLTQWSATEPPAGSVINVGVFMTLGAEYGYPPLPLKRGMSISTG
jgi:hypothetical protein